MVAAEDVLPEAFAHDTDRLARFTLEAKVLASLNHSDIAASSSSTTASTCGRNAVRVAASCARRGHISTPCRGELVVDALRLYVDICKVGRRFRNLMNRTTAARIAGFTLLFYIVVGLSAMAGVFHGAARELATIAQSGSAVVLALTLYFVTRDEGPGLAVLGAIFRLAEGLLGAIVNMTGITVSRPNLVAALLFAVGSMCFCWLLLRGRMMPRALAWLGVAASAILIIALPLQLAGILRGTITELMWMPMLAFEVPGGVWLMVKGVPAVNGVVARSESKSP